MDPSVVLRFAKRVGKRAQQENVSKVNGWVQL